MNFIIIMMNEQPTEVLQIKMVIKGKTKQMFEALKEFYNLGYNAEVMRVLIKKDFDRMVKKTS